LALQALRFPRECPERKSTGPFAGDIPKIYYLNSGKIKKCRENTLSRQSEHQQEVDAFYSFVFKLE
jgi:hypothetical protein